MAVQVIRKKTSMTEQLDDIWWMKWILSFIAWDMLNLVMFYRWFRTETCPTPGAFFWILACVKVSHLDLEDLFDFKWLIWAKANIHVLYCGVLHSSCSNNVTVVHQTWISQDSIHKSQITVTWLYLLHVVCHCCYRCRVQFIQADFIWFIMHISFVELWKRAEQWCL